MMQLILYSITFVTSFIFMQMNHPLAMGLMLLIQTLLICLMTGLITKSFWFSYILFLIFLGGMLVLFIYVTSLASNEMFSFSIKLFISSISMIIFSVLIMWIINNLFFMNLFNNNEMEMINLMNSYISENSLFLYKLYNYPINLMTILLMNYLLITLIAVVKITKLFYGPLRPMN
uniref:NADH-ubiquinone oxidoreductase chain 6 n=1 Tax=Nemopoda mamaevi TaxID=1577136 RepID=A0A0E3G8B8_9MUSC|nr:NADH dehydrogenase subunit 6 [Nemopoda mamaevi]AIY56562.1 NADH dehydrogenase subunit 6 [Nemopoda mamaevi]